MGEVANLARYTANGEDGDADHRRHGVDDGGNDRGDRAEAEQEQDRHEIGEDRHGLHQVEDRPHGALEGRPAHAGKAEEQSAGDAEGNRDQDRGERDHGALPLTEDGEIDKAGGEQDREIAAAGAKREEAGDRRHRDPRKRRQNLDGVRPLAVQEARGERRERDLVGHIDRGGDAARQIGEGEEAEGGVVDQPGHRRRYPRLHRYLGDSGIGHRPRREAVAPEEEHGGGADDCDPRGPEELRTANTGDALLPQRRAHRHRPRPTPASIRRRRRRG